MPPTRLFTTQQNADSLGPTEVINTIDYGKVEELMTKLQGPGVPPAPGGMITKLAANESASVETEAPPVTPSMTIPTAGVCKECGIEHPCSHDIMAARAAGNDMAVSLMNEVRNHRRMAKLNQYEAFVKTAARQENERYLIDAGIKELERAIEAENNKSIETQASKKEASPSEPEFKNVDELTASQKNRFSKWAAAQGWPEEYVQAFLTPKTAEPKIPDHIKVVASNKKLDEGTKKALITDMYKKAKLAPEQASRIKKFWAEELGYQDTEWVDDLVVEPDNK